MISQLIIFAIQIKAKFCEKKAIFTFFANEQNSKIEIFGIFFSRYDLPLCWNHIKMDYTNDGILLLLLINGLE